MVQKDEMLQQTQPEDRAFVAKLLDLVQALENYYCAQLTPFLNPRQVTIAQTLLDNLGISYQVSYEGEFEYNRLLLVPDYHAPEEADFEMVLLEVTYQSKFSQLSHSQILGSLLNGLGLKRQVLGDVLVADGYAQVVVDQRIAPFILANTAKMARTGVSLKEIPFSQRLKPKEETQVFQVQLSSLRLDLLLAKAYNLSRQEAKALIESGQVRLNYQTLTKPEKSLALGDLVSCHRLGRVRLLEEIGWTKTQKRKLMIEKISRKKEGKRC